MPYSEADTRANHIDPALVATFWQPINILREHYFTDGRKLFGGKRGQRCFVDYLLIQNKTFIGIIEAKSEDKEPTEGLQQAIEYAKKLNVRFIFSTNGRKIYEFDLLEGKGYYISKYPLPNELYAKAFTVQNYFDLLSYLSFNKNTITRYQRVAQVKDDKTHFDGYDNTKAKEFLQFILQRYENRWH